MQCCHHSPWFPLFEEIIENAPKMLKFFNILEGEQYNIMAFSNLENRPFAAKPSRDLFFIKLWAITQ